ncbi:PucR family transcriptional regulator [Bacillus marinisedimentorum]|uniref:PucR family transcriptional regulator n=1 Tax=Bacillus marinisedimentorum TaxID=1821260 RepID=UPI0012FFCB14|nr:helix-turn-helix domain-containing protein [Bacillus marinisedimentorum]
MLEQLKLLFKSLIILNEDTSVLEDGYRWFKLNDGTVAGIHENELTGKDEGLLALITEPYEPELSSLTEKQKLWSDVLFKAHVPQSFEKLSGLAEMPYQLVHMTLNAPPSDQVLFQEAIQSLFPLPVTLLWENPQHGVIIVERSNLHKEPQLFKEVIQTLMSDFYVRLSLFAGSAANRLGEASSRYVREQSAFRLMQQAFPGQDVYFLHEAMPFLVMQQAGKDMKVGFRELILNAVEEDENLLETVKAYLESNMNLSLTAKNQFMHRNTVQYRLDKFMEKTGIDLKDFSGAVTTYLALLIEKND